MTNTLYYGDNLDILREYIKDESVDLVYLDPPFNSNATYNVLFEEHTGNKSSAQIKAFEDTWIWGPDSDKAYREMVEKGGQVSLVLQAFRQLHGKSNIVAYLSMMAPRLVELNRVLKQSGSIYLHCDPTASHYLKILLDAVFGKSNFRNEIIWYYGPKATQNESHFQRKHDVILYYAKSSETKFNTLLQEYSEGSLEERETRYKFEDENGKYRLTTRRDSEGKNIELRFICDLA